MPSIYWIDGITKELWIKQISTKINIQPNSNSFLCSHYARVQVHATVPHNNDDDIHHMWKMKFNFFFYFFLNNSIFREKNNFIMISRWTSQRVRRFSMWIFVNRCVSMLSCSCWRNKKKTKQIFIDKTLSWNLWLTEIMII